MIEKATNNTRTYCLRMVNIDLPDCFYALSFTFWENMQGLVENGARCEIQLSCCASNFTVNFSTIIVERAGEPVSGFNLNP